MIHLALRTEYSFKKAFAPMKNVVEVGDIVGIADFNNTYGHVKLWQECKKKNVKPIFGVRLMVVKNPEERGSRSGYFGPEFIFIAKNLEGLQEIYRLVKIAYKNYYYRPMISYVDVWRLSENVIVIAHEFEMAERIDYIGLSVLTRPSILDYDLPRVAIDNNYYLKPEDKSVYELIAGSQKRGDGYSYLFENHTYPQHMLTEAEHLAIWHDEQAIVNTHTIAQQCNVELPIADPVRYKGEEKLLDLCIKGAFRKSINIEKEPYKSRLKRELDLIDEKQFGDYFLIVAEMVEKAKKKMLVGPGRGSSGGSLVCFLINITEIDPIPHGLLFERFIDINRHDMPDIDIDFPDFIRQQVLKELTARYGEDHVCHIGTIMRLKPKLAINSFAIGMNIPISETEEVKGAIIQRSGGDARAAMCVGDTFDTTDIGKEYIKKFPNMRLVEKAEQHAFTSGIHAAGILVSNEPITNYTGVDVRQNVAMIDGNEAEALNLLKIDCLGLRTLSILQECAELSGFDFHDYYKLKLNDDKVFKIFRDHKLNGIFQFEGYALQNLTRSMDVELFDDIVAITALARPGPLHSGGAALFVKRRNGEEPVEYLYDHEIIIKYTKSTYGAIVFQEQVMSICKELGAMSWKDVSLIRKGMGKSKGKEFFNKFRAKFIEGAETHSIIEKDAISIWDNMLSFGAYGFNKSHAVEYALISYWSAWSKCYHPIEFATANMNNTKDNNSALKLLREMTESDGIEYIPVDPNSSGIKWTVKDGKMLGGLMNIHGIGIAKARKMIKDRKAKNTLTPAIQRIFDDPKTPFDILFPCRHFFGDYFLNYEKYGIPRPLTLIKDVRNDPGEYCFIGKVIDKNIRDLNEYVNVVARGGEIIEGPHILLNITIEDDTDAIMCRIGKDKFEIVGKHIAENAAVDVDYVYIRGKILNQGWRFIFITEIRIIGSGEEKVWT